ncbi:hypothetical protein [Alkalicoccus halolimnae]|uniref:Uncharacterized protein n=1 Tax=Alkalicoccus halolimnae TaxID=1667239 RepID=A0AAJ8LTH9_9BACI|nr:hypothetical protein [Alkalicoccus halolimnae]
MENRPLQGTWGDSRANQDEPKIHPARPQGGRDQLRPARPESVPMETIAAGYRSGD